MGGIASRTTPPRGDHTRSTCELHHTGLGVAATRFVAELLRLAGPFKVGFDSS